MRYRGRRARRRHRRRLTTDGTDSDTGLDLPGREEDASSTASSTDGAPSLFTRPTHVMGPTSESGANSMTGVNGARPGGPMWHGLMRQLRDESHRGAMLRRLNDMRNGATCIAQLLTAVAQNVLCLNFSSGRSFRPQSAATTAGHRLRDDYGRKHR